MLVDYDWIAILFSKVSFYFRSIVTQTRPSILSSCRQVLLFILFILFDSIFEVSCLFFVWSVRLSINGDDIVLKYCLSFFLNRFGKCCYLANSAGTSRAWRPLTLSTTWWNVSTCLHLLVWRAACWHRPVRLEIAPPFCAVTLWPTSASVAQVHFLVTLVELFLVVVSQSVEIYSKRKCSEKRRRDEGRMTEQCAQEEEEAARSIKASFSRAKEPSSVGADDPDRAAVSSLSLFPLCLLL